MLTVELPEHIWRRYVNQNRTTAECGPGWLSIILDIDHALRQVNPDYKIFNIKQKHGTLDYQLPYTDDKMDLLLSVGAANKSWETCELCGQPGKLHCDGWERVRCVSCCRLESEDEGSDRHEHVILDSWTGEAIIENGHPKIGCYECFDEDN